MGFAEGTPTRVVELGGKSHTLAFTIGTLRRASELGVLNLDAEDAVQRMLKLPEYVWAALDEDGRKALTVDAVAELLNPSNLQVIGEAIGELFSASMPKEKDDPNVSAAPVEKPSAANSTLTSSGPSGSSISASRTKPSGESLSVSL